MGAVLSFVRERERIFLRWLSEVERLLGDRVIAMLHSRHGLKATAPQNMRARLNGAGNLSE